MQKDKRLGQQIDKVNPICPNCKHYLILEPRGLYELKWLYSCKNCGASFNKVKNDN